MKKVELLYLSQEDILSLDIGWEALMPLSMKCLFFLKKWMLAVSNG